MSELAPAPIPPSPIPPSRRGACPAFQAPMETGDGLILRLVPADGALSPAQVRGLAAAARAFGNGMVEVTARGSLQVRGLTPETVAPLQDAVRALGITPRLGLPVDVSPLSGLDPAERADARALAARIGTAAEALAERLGPKVSVVIDGGGAIRLDGRKADIRLVAAGGDAWSVSIGGGAAETLAIEAACARTLDVLAAIAARGRGARATDLAARERAVLRPASAAEVRADALCADGVESGTVADQHTDGQALPLAGDGNQHGAIADAGSGDSLASDAQSGAVADQRAARADLPSAEHESQCGSTADVGAGAPLGNDARAPLAAGHGDRRGAIGDATAACVRDAAPPCADIRRDPTVPAEGGDGWDLSDAWRMRTVAAHARPGPAGGLDATRSGPVIPDETGCGGPAAGARDRGGAPLSAPRIGRSPQAAVPSATGTVADGPAPAHPAEVAEQPAAVHGAEEHPQVPLPDGGERHPHGGGGSTTARPTPLLPVPVADATQTPTAATAIHDAAHPPGAHPPGAALPDGTATLDTVAAERAGFRADGTGAGRQADPTTSDARPSRTARGAADASAGPLSMRPHPRPPHADAPAAPLGAFPLADGSCAFGVGLPFGAGPAELLEAIADLAEAAGARDLRPAPERVLLLTGLAPAALPGFAEGAAALGLIAAAGDPRAAVAACPGAPACASAHFPARAMAAEVARALAPLLDGSVSVHLSACTKGCARPAAATLTLVGVDGGIALVHEGRAAEAAGPVIAPDALPARLSALAAAARTRPSDARGRDILRGLDLRSLWAAGAREPEAQP